MLRGAGSLLFNFPPLQKAGGGESYPTSITDDFSADSGAWLDGDLTAAAIAVSDGKGIWTPTEGENVLLNGGFDSADNWDLGANWTIGSGVATKTAGVGSALTQAGVYTVGTWYRITAGTYEVAGTFRSTESTSYVLAGPCATARATDTVFSYFGNSSSSGNVDDLAVYPLIQSTLFRLQRVYYPSYVEAKIWRSSLIQRGVVIYKDASNFICSSLIGSLGVSGQVVILFKRVAGTFSMVATQVTSYSAGAALRLIPNSTFNAFSVTYGGVEVIASTAITDFAADVGPWYVGLLNTYNPDDTATDAFDDFAAEAVSGASPF